MLHVARDKRFGHQELTAHVAKICTRSAICSLADEHGTPQTLISTHVPFGGRPFWKSEVLHAALLSQRAARSRFFRLWALLQF